MIVRRSPRRDAWARIALTPGGPYGAFVVRAATGADTPALERLIEQSDRALLSCHCSARQLDAALGTALALDMPR